MTTLRGVARITTVQIFGRAVSVSRQSPKTTLLCRVLVFYFFSYILLPPAVQKCCSEVILKKNCLLLSYESKFLIHGKLINIFPFYFEGLATLMLAPTPKFNFQILREFAVDIYFTHIIPWNARKHVFISSIRIAFSSFLTCVM